MFVAHPLYRIPLEYRATRRLFVDDPMCLRTQDPDSGDLLVFATVLAPDHRVEEEDLDWEGPLSDFAPAYTPTAEEVVRALRGPEGPPGPAGAPARLSDPYASPSSVYGGAL